MLFGQLGSLDGPDGSNMSGGIEHDWAQMPLFYVLHLWISKNIQTTGFDWAGRRENGSWPGRSEGYLDRLEETCGLRRQALGLYGQTQAAGGRKRDVRRVCGELLSHQWWLLLKIPRDRYEVWRKNVWTVFVLCLLWQLTVISISTDDNIYTKIAKNLGLNDSGGERSPKNWSFLS